MAKSNFKCLTFCLIDFEKYPALDASRIWNCDETGFPTDANKGTVIMPKVNKIYLNH